MQAFESESANERSVQFSPAHSLMLCVADKESIKTEWLLVQTGLGLPTGLPVCSPLSFPTASRVAEGRPGWGGVVIHMLSGARVVSSSAGLRPHPAEADSASVSTSAVSDGTHTYTGVELISIG